MKLNYRLCVFITTISIVLLIVYLKNTFIYHNLNFLSNVSNTGQINRDSYDSSDSLLKSEVYKGTDNSGKPNEPSELASRLLRSNEIILVVVTCGVDRLQETLVMIKSAIFFCVKVKLRVVVVTDLDLIKSFKEKLSEWRGLMNNSFSFEVHPVHFPENEDQWRHLFKPCAAQRLFLPSVLKHLDSVLYVDTDTLFLAPLSEVWQHFGYMNDSQMAALAPEHEDPNTGWYNRFARHPFYGRLGVNSGVMLMNLTRMRQFGWEKYLLPIYKEFKLKITWGDQDIINIIFHYHPERLYVYSCRYNYRSDHCMYMSVCNDATKKGVAVIHGSRGTFHSDKQPAFRAIFRAMEEFQLDTDPYTNLLLPMESYLEQTTTTNCGKISHIFVKNMKKYIPVKEQYR